MNINEIKNYCTSFQENGGSTPHIDEVKYIDFLKSDKQYGLPILLAECEDLRNGVLRLKDGNTVKTQEVPVSFNEMVQEYYGVDSYALLASFGFNPKTDKVGKLAEIFDHKNFSFADALESLTNRDQLSFATGASSPYANSRGIVGELWLDIIRRGAYKSNFLKWISGSEDQNELTYVAHVHRKVGKSLSERSEFETLSRTTYEYATKSGDLSEFASDILLSEKLLIFSKFSHVSDFLEDSSSDIGMMQEKKAINVLINGDLANGDESAPVCGVQNTTTGFAEPDFNYVTEFMKANNTMPDFVIGSLGTTARTNTNTMPGASTFQSIAKATGIETFASIVPANLLIFGSRKAMQHHRKGSVGLTNSTRKDTQGNTIVKVSAWSAFSIRRRDARAVLNKSLAWVEGSATDFPAYMNVFSQINNS